MTFTFLSIYGVSSVLSIAVDIQIKASVFYFSLN